jgi:hypothetical protein
MEPMYSPSFRSEMAEMAMSDYAEIVLQAGLFHNAITVEAIYELATKVSNDEIVSKRRLEKARQGHSQASSSTATVLREMTQQERVELRERVAGVVKLKPTTPQGRK